MESALATLSTIGKFRDITDLEPWVHATRTWSTLYQANKAKQKSTDEEISLSAGIVWLQPKAQGFNDLRELKKFWFQTSHCPTVDTHVQSQRQTATGFGLQLRSEDSKSVLWLQYPTYDNLPRQALWPLTKVRELFFNAPSIKDERTSMKSFPAVVASKNCAAEVPEGNSIQADAALCDAGRLR